MNSITTKVIVWVSSLSLVKWILWFRPTIKFIALVYMVTGYEFIIHPEEKISSIILIYTALAAIYLIAKHLITKYRSYKENKQYQDLWNSLTDEEKEVLYAYKHNA